MGFTKAKKSIISYVQLNPTLSLIFNFSA